MSATPNFDRVARAYRWGEYLFHGRLLERVRGTFLSALGDRQNALVLGDGDGRFLAGLLATHPPLQVLAVDASARMLQLLQGRCIRASATSGSRLRTLHMSALDLVIPPGLDLVVTHFFLDCFSTAELQVLAQRLARGVSPHALWLVSDFDLPRSRLLGWLAKVYLRALYAAFRLLTGLRVQHLPPIAAILERAGFHRLERREFAAGLLYSEIWQLGTSAGGQGSFTLDVGTSS